MLVGVGDALLVEMAIGAQQGDDDVGLADIELDMGGRRIGLGRRPPYVAPRFAEDRCRRHPSVDRPNRILHVTDHVVLVGAARSPDGQSVPLASAQDAAERLLESGEISIDAATVGYRSGFIGAVLSALPGTRASTDPRRIVLVSQEWPPATP